MDKLNKAILFATEAHKGQKRKMTGIPSILHSLEAATIVSALTSDEDVICAAVLHDVVEDTEYEIGDIEKRFGARIAGLVGAETENKRFGLPPSATWKIRKEETLAHLSQTSDINVKFLWLGDKLSNIRAIYFEYLKHGDEIWENFNQRDKAKQQWYYESVVEVLRSDLKNSPVFWEYERLVNTVFKKEK